MLQVARDLLPQSLLSYAAFRIAVRETSERFLDADFPEFLGYLAEVPFLRDVAPAVQLDLLAATWDRHMSRTTHIASLLDESVLYAVCEFSAGLVERQPDRALRMLRGGPLDLAIPVDHALASDLRSLHLKLSNDGDFLLIGQLLDLNPEESLDWKNRLGIAIERIEPLFEALGRWHPSPELVGNLHGLISVAEAQQLSKRLRVRCPV